MKQRSVRNSMLEVKVATASEVVKVGNDITGVWKADMSKYDRDRFVRHLFLTWNAHLISPRVSQY